MIYFYVFLMFYFSAGFGFAIASYLQHAEAEVKAKKEVPSFFNGTMIFFIVTWFSVALYCYRAEIKRTIQPIDFSNKR